MEIFSSKTKKFQNVEGYAPNPHFFTRFKLIITLMGKFQQNADSSTRWRQLTFLELTTSTEQQLKLHLIPYLAPIIN